jgi:hypothetical protein
MTYDEASQLAADNAERFRVAKLPRGRDGKRKAHSHRCDGCRNAAKCQKGQCLEPQRIAKCGWC